MILLEVQIAHKYNLSLLIEDEVLIKTLFCLIMDMTYYFDEKAIVCVVKSSCLRIQK